MDVARVLPTRGIPSGARLTGCSGDATDLPPAVLQEFLEAVAAGDAVVPIGRVLHLEEIQEAHRVMEANSAGGKLVVVTSSAASAPGRARRGELPDRATSPAG